MGVEAVEFTLKSSPYVSWNNIVNYREKRNDGNWPNCKIKEAIIFKGLKVLTSAHQ